MNRSNQPSNLDILDALALRFAASEQVYASPGGKYQEAEARSEFIDPLLDALGWDTANRAGLIAASREVLREETQRRENSFSKKPDYTLRYHGERMLYVEAKKPSVDILKDMDAIFQARAYGYTDSHPIVVLTNFKSLSVYDTTVPAREGDLPEVCRIFTCNYSEYKSRIGELEKLLGRESVVSSGWADQFTSTRPEHAVPADETFIAQINAWRIEVAADIVSRHPGTKAEMLNDVVQKLINRLVFVRMCEDRGIEGEAILRDAAKGSAADIQALFASLHRRYNTGLFDQTHVQAEPTLLMDSDLLSRIINRLYSPYSPFSFAVLDADFLGLVYETSLAEHLVVTDVDGTKEVNLNQKLEYSRRDVVTTPQRIVDATVQRTWNQAAPDFVNHMKVLDFAAGSGRFLVSAFDQYVTLFTEHLIAESSPRLVQIAPGEYRLPFEEKCALLKDNFFGIDVDFNAVEVARFSLLVRLLEDETKASLPDGQKILPDLDANIIPGNTLVRKLPGATTEQLTLAVPLDLTSTALPAKFDVIVGNPPYMKTEEMKAFNFAEYQYLKDNYLLLHRQFDKYIAFIEFALDHVTDTGVIGVVIPNKWMTIVAGEKLRGRFRLQQFVADLANFRHVQVFAAKSIYVCTLVLTRAGQDTFTYSEPGSFEEFTSGGVLARVITAGDLPTSPSDAWVLPANEYESTVLSGIRENSLPLGTLVDARNGIQTSKNKVYILEGCRIADGYVTFEKKGVSWSIEEEVTRPYLEDSRSVRSHHSVVPDARVIFPYRATAEATDTIPVADMQRDFPKAYEYLAANESGMKDRDMAEVEGSVPFYTYGRNQAIGYATQSPKIFYSVNQRGDKYGIDETGIVYSSGGTAGEVALYPTDSGYSLDFVLALLDQAPIEFFLRKRGSPFRGGYFARGTDAIADVPVPKLDFEDATDVSFHDSVSRLTKDIRDLNAKTKTLAPQQMGLHQEKVRAAKSKVAELFAVRWGLARDEYLKLNLSAS
ncbi:N-6 DNA methylase [Cryobacterium sp. TMT2-23]|uniref:Eco57I restriction-modification methylase domain-containing protein n=1 Tax=Cryobacterium sp. TMT2-23 TaxID=1259252 RepID=UPI001F53E668|nr:N-6 DNA methylase [Cryobacterium sp. TMT2-23]